MCICVLFVYGIIIHFIILCWLQSCLLLSLKQLSFESIQNLIGNYHLLVKSGLQKCLN